MNRGNVDNKFFKELKFIFCKTGFSHPQDPVDKGPRAQKKMLRILLLRAFCPLWLTSFSSEAEKKHPLFISNLSLLFLF